MATSTTDSPRVRKLDLKDCTYFPRAIDLPEVGYDEDDTMRFYTGTMTEPQQAIYRTFRTDKKIHWCFIGERVPSPVPPGKSMLAAAAALATPGAHIPTSLGEMPNIRTTNGEAILFDIVTGYEDWRGDWRDSLLPQLLPKFKMGYTIAAIFSPAVSKGFTRWWTCFLRRRPRSARTVRTRRLWSALAASSVLIVRKFVMGFSRQPCQNTHWRDGHKDECRAVTRLREWSAMNCLAKLGSETYGVCGDEENRGQRAVRPLRNGDSRGERNSTQRVPPHEAEVVPISRRAGVGRSSRQ
ncbi:hypothetical protein B0H16DRAFT_1470000 [Mycena metata]|uniref:Uncharacterized protein n=1 Tax=Mycena metata TaxID=1033252 RepID=A0AAD7HVP8_9AGAR|nr:hypothetical protein B0H16DRAFT_1470000 [Mycena metata]